MNEKSKFFRVAITGVTGRMGKELVQCILHKKYNINGITIVLGSAITRLDSSCCGMDVGKFMHSSMVGVVITDDLKKVKEDFDILIDFTTSVASIEYIQFCLDNNKNMVIGTTGFTEKDINFIKHASKKIGIVFSSNFSVGISILFEVINQIIFGIGDVSDINIIESHHNKKSDIPSGTALMIKDVIKNSLLLIVNKEFTNNIDNKLYSSFSKLYSHLNIPIHSIRSGNIVGEHTVLFSNSGESLEITHKAFDRVIFAQGALRAAAWLGIERIGLFSMRDVLK